MKAALNKSIVFMSSILLITFSINFKYFNNLANFVFPLCTFFSYKEASKRKKAKDGEETRKKLKF